MSAGLAGSCFAKSLPTATCCCKRQQDFYNVLGHDSGAQFIREGIIFSLFDSLLRCVLHSINCWLYCAACVYVCTCMCVCVHLKILQPRNRLSRFFTLMETYPRYLTLRGFNVCMQAVQVYTHTSLLFVCKPLLRTRLQANSLYHEGYLFLRYHLLLNHQSVESPGWVECIYVLLSGTLFWKFAHYHLLRIGKNHWILRPKIHVSWWALSLLSGWSSWVFVLVVHSFISL